MRGSITKKHGQYYIRVDIGVDPITNKRKQKWIAAGTDKKKAEKKLSEVVSEILNDKYIEPSNLTLGDYLKRWLEVVESKVRISTFDSYSWAVNHRIVPELGEILLDKIKPITIQKYYQNLLKSNLSVTSIRYIHRVLSMAFKQAVRWQMINNNPCLNIDPPKKEKYQAAILDPQQIQYLLSQIQKSKLYLPILLAVTCGLRRGEICALRHKDVDLEKGIMYVENTLSRRDGTAMLSPVKTQNSKRAVSLPKLTVDAIKNEKRKQAENKLRLGSSYDINNYICAKEDGSSISPNLLSRQFAKMIETINLPKVRFHDLRHSHATFLLMSNVPVKTVSERLGHASSSFTNDVYGHILPPMQEHAANVVDSLLDVCPKK